MEFLPLLNFSIKSLRNAISNVCNYWYCDGQSHKNTILHKIVVFAVSFWWAIILRVLTGNLKKDIWWFFIFGTSVFHHPLKLTLCQVFKSFNSCRNSGCLQGLCIQRSIKNIFVIPLVPPGWLIRPNFTTLKLTHLLICEVKKKDYKVVVNIQHLK